MMPGNRPLAGPLAAFRPRAQQPLPTEVTYSPATLSDDTIERAERAAIQEESGSQSPVVTEALRLFSLGLHAVPIPPGRKGPLGTGWPSLRLTPREIPIQFRAPSNLGILTGEASGGLWDLDLDCPEAVSLASAWAPFSDLIHGRQSAPSSHRWYHGTAGSLRRETFKDPETGQMLLELRGDGHQTMAPPSTHPDGEPVRYERRGQPGKVTLAELLSAAKRIAAGALLCDRWKKTSRHGGAVGHDAGLALAGFLLRRWSLEETLDFLGTIADAAGAPRWKVEADTRDTWKRLQAGEPVTGMPTLQSFFSEKVLAAAFGWLGLDRSQERPAPAAIAVPTASDQNGPHCRSLADIYASPPPAPEWRVEGLILAGGISGLIGRPKIGKTFLLFQAGLCSAAGLHFLGRKTKPARILYIDEETGLPVLYQRLLRARGADPAFADQGVLDRFFLVSLTGLSVEQPDRVRREIDKARPDLLIIDSFRRFHRGDENDSAHVAKTMAFFADLRRDYSLDLLLSHHTRKNLEGSEFWEDAARGSGDFFAACDGLMGAGKRGKGLIELRASLRAAPEPLPMNLAMNEEILFWEQTSCGEGGKRFDPLKAIEETLLSKPEHRWPQKLVVGELMALHNLTDKQARNAIARVPEVDPLTAPPGVRLLRWVIPGTKNAKEVILR